jgi:hypothetical protein
MKSKIAVKKSQFTIGSGNNLMVKTKATSIAFVVSIISIFATIDKVQAAIIIDFTEGLAEVGQHGLTWQYQPSFGLTFLPSSGNNWTLADASVIYPWVDERGAYLSGSPLTLGFAQAVDFITFDTWMQKSGIAGLGGNISVTVSSLTSPGGAVIESTEFAISISDSGTPFFQPVQLSFAPSAAFNYVSILHQVKTGIDSISFSPGYSGGGGTSGVPEAKTWAMSLLVLAGIGGHLFIKKLKRLRLQQAAQITTP